jgi:hypothetical protein
VTLPKIIANPGTIAPEIIDAIVPITNRNLSLFPMNVKNFFKGIVFGSFFYYIAGRDSDVFCGFYINIIIIIIII